MADSHTHELSSIELFTDKGDQLVDIVHDQIKDNVCLRVSSQRFSVARRDTPAYSRLLAVSNTYGYIVAGTPKGLSVFMTADAQDELSKGVSKGTNTAVTLSARKEIDLSAHGKVTHVGISADELSVLAATVRGSLLVFAAAALVGQGDGTPAKVIRVGQEIRDMRPNPQDAPTSVAVLTLAGDVLIVDMAQGTSKTIVPASSPRVTAICWSRKGKQIACGDTRATLTHRSPSDGSIKSTIAALATEDAIPDGAAVLAVEWMAASCFFAVYGALPGGAFTPCSGGGGEDGGSEDENDSDNTTTAAYIITRVGKTAPWEWIYVEDPCSSMICPERYPGFHTACISDWGPSAQNIVIMSGTGSDATMTIGEAATLKASDGSADPRSLDWAQWDIDGGMAVMPLSALASDGVDDAFPIGMAVDYTGRHELPPEEDGGLPVKPVPILWILNTDACLLGYHVCNTHEMRRGGRSAHMVNAVKALPGASASTIPAAASSTLEPAKTTAFASGTAFGAQKSTGASAFGASSSALSGFGKPSGTSAFGAASGFAPSFGGSSAFGKSSSIAPIVKAPTALGTPGKHVFGSGTGMGASTATTAFGMLGAAAPPAGKSIFDAPSSGPSIFDSPSSGPSIFDAPAKGSESSSFGPAKPFGSAMAATAFGSKTAGPKAAGFEASSADASTAGGNAKKSVTFGDTTVFEIPKPTAFNISTPAPEAASTFASLSSGGKLGAAAPKPLLTPTPAALKPSLTSTPAAVATQVQRAQEEQEQEQEKEREEAEARRRKEQEQQAAQQRELEAKAQELIDQQYVNTCNSLDRELKALAASVNRTDEAIARMRATRLPPIQVDPAVQSMAKLTSQMKDMSIDDTELWNRTADVLLEALHVSRDELRDSQRSLSRQLSMLMKTETKREEITRILGMASASASAPLASSPPHSASSDGGLNPLQRDYQRRLKSAFGLIAKRAVDVEQVVNAEADRHQSERDELPRSLRAPTLDSIQRTLNNVSKTLDQKNGELDDLVDLVNDLNLGPQSDQLRKKPRPPPLPLIAVGGTLESPGDGGRRPGEQQTGTPLTAASGVPWSPKNLLFAGPPSGKRSRGYGLHDEDVLAGGSPMTHGPAGLPYDRACQLEASPLPGEAVSAPKPAHFARTQVRELVPRSARTLRKASLVADSEAVLGGCDDASVAPSTLFSTAATHLQTRRQRAVARDVLTRPTRAVAVFRSPEASIAHALELAKGGRSALLDPVSMPNLERYVKAFGKLKITEPAPALAPEITPASKFAPAPAPASETNPLQQGFGKLAILAKSSNEWTCGTCELTNPTSAAACLVCEEARPGALPASSRPATNTPVPPVFGGASSGFQLSGGTSFGAPLSAASGPASASSFGSFRAKPTSASPFGQSAAKPAAATQPFPSFAPPTMTSAPEKPAAAPTLTGFQPTGGTSFGSFLPQGAQKPKIDLSARPALSFTSFVPPGGAMPADKPAPAKPEPAGRQWICDLCMLTNPSDATQCFVCESPRSDNPKLAPLPTTATTKSSAKGDETARLVPAATDGNTSESDYSSSAASESGSDSDLVDSDDGLESDNLSESDLVSDGESDLVSDGESDLVSDGENEHLSDGESEHLSDGESKDNSRVPDSVPSAASEAEVPANQSVPDGEKNTGEKGDVESTTGDGGDSANPKDDASSASEHSHADDSEDEACGKPSSSEDHDSDDFVHVSQQLSVLGDRDEIEHDDDAASTPAVIIGSSDVTPTTSERAGSPAIVRDAGADSDNDAEAKVAAGEAADSRAADDARSPTSDAPLHALDIGVVLGLVAGIGIGGVVDAGLRAPPSLPPAEELRSEANVVPDSISEAETEEAVEEAADTLEPEPGNEPVPDVEELSKDDASATGSDKVSEEATDELPESDKCEDASEVDSKASSPPASPTRSALLKSQTGSSGEFVMLSHPDTSSDATPPTSDGASDGGASDGGDGQAGFNMDSFAAGIESASAGAAGSGSEQVGTPEPLDTDSEGEQGSSEDSRSDASPSKPAPASQASLGSLAGSSGAGSFFKAGRLGDFGGSFKPAGTSTGAAVASNSALPSAFATQAPPATAAFGARLDKPAFGVASMSSFGAQATGGQTLPNAFATAAQSSIPAFGAKLDKPVFGVASMSSFGAKSGSLGASSSFASLAKAPSGFGAHATAAQSSFAAIREKSDLSGGAAHSDSQGSASIFAQKGEVGFGWGVGAQKAQKPASRPQTASNDPIRSIIQAGDSDGGASDSGDDSD